MTSNLEQLRLPSRAQCNDLTDSQCRMIQAYLDPHDLRLNKDWERQYQPELIRLYMQLLSFTRIEDAMRSRIVATYKTYNNRFREWFFPVDRDGREQAVRMLYSWLTDGDNGIQSTTTISPPKLSIRPAFRHRLLLPARPQPNAYVNSSSRFQSATQSHSPQVRLSTSTYNSFNSSGSSSAQSNRTFFDDDDVFSNPRFSTATAATAATVSTAPSSISAASQYQSAPSKPPIHDAELGLWNDDLRVIPCGVDHSALRWYDSFTRCSTCGFSQWHALMLNARSMEVSEYSRAMDSLIHVEQVDFAGNYPLHFLMSAGVSMIYFKILAGYGDTDHQNVFGQNPLHLLNPQDLGDQLISFLEWFKAREQPPGLLLTQRDIFGRTPLHMLLQHPVERHTYRQLFDVFPFAVHQLQALNNKGHSVMTMMMKSATRIMTESPSAFAKIQVGIAEVKTYLYDSQVDLTQRAQEYGFHDIARGDRNGMYYGVYPQCRICHTKDHSNSSLDQLQCACASGRDRNGPDGSGLTPAHALVLLSRCNNDPAHTPETAAQTAELFRALVPAGNPNWREILHVLDPGGRSLIFNVSVGGFDEILRHILALEDQVRHRAMVNSCMKTRKGESCSVLATVQKRLREVMKEIAAERNGSTREALKDLAERLLRVECLLINTGAEVSPSVRTRWQISYL